LLSLLFYSKGENHGSKNNNQKAGRKEGSRKAETASKGKAESQTTPEG
jgi:hypothetical protein